MRTGPPDKVLPKNMEMPSFLQLNQMCRLSGCSIRGAELLDVHAMKTAGFTILLLILIFVCVRVTQRQKVKLDWKE